MLGDQVPACSYFRTVLLSGRRVVVAQPRCVAAPGLIGMSPRAYLRQGWAERSSVGPHLALVVSNRQFPYLVRHHAARRTSLSQRRAASACCVRGCSSIPRSRASGQTQRYADLAGTKRTNHLAPFFVPTSPKVLEFPVPVTWKLPGSDREMAICMLGDLARRISLPMQATADSRQTDTASHNTIDRARRNIQRVCLSLMVFECATRSFAVSQPY